MQTQVRPGAAWRPWLLLVVSGGGALLSFLGGGLLIAFGGVSLISLPQSSLNALAMLNLAWVMLLVGVLSLPALVYAFLEIRGKSIALPPSSGKLFLVASAGMLLWALLVFLFEPVETSRLAWLFLPPLVLLTSVLPLWWYIETGRRGHNPEPPLRTWGLTSISLLLTLPLILTLEMILLVLIVLGVGVYMSSQPGFMEQLAIVQGLLSDPGFDPQIINDMLMGLLQQPGVIFGLLVVVAGIVPLIEELFKPLAVWLFAADRMTPAQGFTGGMISGACFALWENLTALSASGDGSGTFILVARVGTGLLHIVTAGLVGWGMASFWQSRRYLGRMLGAYFLAVALHGLWNAAGVISGVAPMLQFPLEALDTSRVIESAAIGTLVALIIVNFILLLYANARLRRTETVDAAPEDAPGILMSGLAGGQIVQTSDSVVEDEQGKLTGDPHGVD